jgi:hypothetical protein
LKQLVKYGFNPVFFAKAGQVAVGIAQIVTEPVPGVDAAADVAAATMDQYGYNVEIGRALNQFKLYLRNLAPGAQRHSRMYPVPGFTYGPVVFTGASSPDHSYGPPLAEVSLEAALVLDRPIPFRIFGELPVTQDLEIYDLLRKVAKPLGIQERDGMYYLPPDISLWVEEDLSEGDGVLEGFGRYRRKNSLSSVVSWVATCRRGAQVLKVRLRNGEIALGPRVVNRYMNQITDLQLAGVSALPVEVWLGQWLSGLRIIGTSRYLEQAFWPDLTRRSECLDISLASSGTVR